MADLQRRCAEAEARQQEAAARIPEATSALMRQLEAMQAASSQQAAAWAEAERGLQERLRQAEAAAGGAAGQAAHLGRELEEVRAQLAAATEQVGFSWLPAGARCPGQRCGWRVGLQGRGSNPGKLAQAPAPLPEPTNAALARPW